MLVWYRDTTYGNINHVTANIDGAAELRLQGRPAHRRQPLRPVPAARRGGRQGPVHAEQPAVPAAVVEHRVQPAADVPVQGVLRGLPAEPFSEYCTDFGRAGAVAKFTDAKGWYPGIEVRDGRPLFYRDIDASVGHPVRRQRRRTRPGSSTRRQPADRVVRRSTSGWHRPRHRQPRLTRASPTASRSRSSRRAKDNSSAHRARRAGALVRPIASGLRPGHSTSRPSAPPGASARPGSMTPASPFLVRAAHCARMATWIVPLRAALAGRRRVSSTGRRSSRNVLRSRGPRDRDRQPRSPRARSRCRPRWSPWRPPSRSTTRTPSDPSRGCPTEAP